MSGSLAPRDLDSPRLRSHIEAALLDVVVLRSRGRLEDRLKETIGALTGTIVELGPGTGVNLRYYAPGVRVIAVEPNPVMRDKLATNAQRHGVDIDIRAVRGERIDVDDGSADAVLATLVLCGVDDPAQVITEAHRVLKPGGSFFFMEHVAAPEDSLTRRVQGAVKVPHRWMFNGCEVDRDTAALLRASNFSEVDIEEIDCGPGDLYVRHRIIGTATKSQRGQQTKSQRG